MKEFIFLIKKEYWENKSMWATPILLCLLFITVGLYNENIVVNIDVMNGNNNGPIDIIAPVLFLCSTIFLAIQSFFYMLFTLFNERKDGSHFFWKSLPISSSQIVLSKFSVGVLLLLFAFVISIVSSVIILLLTGKAFSSSLFITTINFLVKAELMTLIVMFPVLSWGLFVSSSSSKNPFVMGVLLPLFTLILLYLFGATDVATKIIVFISEPIGNWFSLLAEQYVVDFIEVQGLEYTHKVDMFNMLSTAPFWGYIITGLSFVYASIWKQKRNS